MNEWAQATIDHDVFPTQYKTNIKIGNSLIMKQVIMKLEPQGWVPNTKLGFQNQCWQDWAQRSDLTKIITDFGFSDNF